MKRSPWSAVFVVGGVVGAWSVFSPPAAGRQGPPPPPPPVPLPGLTAAENQQFQQGARAFGAQERQNTGLGPVFNGVACAECHRSAGIGGASTNLRVDLVTRIGGTDARGAYSDLAEYGGPLMQARSLRETLRGYPVAGEVVPVQAKFISHRQTTPIFGAGLIEAIPDATILALAKTSRPDGIKGVVNMVTNPETGRLEVGRFGWKSQVSTLHWFSADAYVNEMGITNRVFKSENLPQGKSIPAGADIVPDPEETGTDVETNAAFMRFLAPIPTLPQTPDAVKGQAVFEQIRCSSCHVPSMQTGTNASRALSNITVALYSDLLLHKMGTGLTDGIQQGLAKGDQFRTAPLWGVSKRPFLLHDGRATTLDQAIRLHDGEALKSKTRYAALGAKNRAALLEFLGGL